MRFRRKRRKDFLLLADSKGGNKMIIQIENLEKSFSGDCEVIRIKKFELGHNEIISMYGRSGCGKTTLLNILSGVLGGYSGSVKICGTEMKSLGERDLDLFRAKNIGYIFQNLNLLQGYTAYENLELSLQIAGVNYSRDGIMQYLEIAGLFNESGKYPSQLSLGQQQRIAVLRAVMKRPPLILADEPTSSLDSQNSAAVVDLLKKSAAEAGSALITVSHEKDVISAFDKKLNFSDINMSRGAGVLDSIEARPCLASMRKAGDAN